MSETPDGPPADEADETTRLESPSGAEDDPRPWYRKKRFLLPIVAVLAFLFGIVVGSEGEPPTETTAEVESLQEELAEVEEERDGLEEELTELEAEREDEEAQEAENDERVEKLQERVAGFEQQVTRLQDERDTLQTRNAEQAQQIDQLESELASAQQSQSAPQPQPQQEQPSQAGAHYENCSEARAAGAAPLRRGEPGYRDALDRDNDGVACE